MTAFAKPVANATSTLASAYVAGSGTMTLASASSFGSLSGGQFLRVSAFPASAVVGTPASGRFQVTAISGNVLTIAGTLDGFSDGNLAAGTIIAATIAEGTIGDIHTAIGNLETITEVSITGATTLTSAAFGKLHVCSGTSANYTVTLPTAVGNAGKTIGVRMALTLTKLVTLHGNASETIGGAATRVMWAGESALLLSDGAGWNKLNGKSIRMSCKIALNADQANSNGVHAITYGATIVDNTNLMADLANHRTIAPRDGIYRVDLITTYGALPGNTRVFQAVLKNGATLFQYEQYDISGSNPVIYGGDEVPLVAGDVITGQHFNLESSTETLAGTGGSVTSLSVKEFDPW